MWGWLKAEIALASRSKRALRSGSEERCEGRTLMATFRPSRVSRARYTSPMPPAPNGDWISYGPSFVPEVSPIRARNYSLYSTVARGCRLRAVTPRSWIILEHENSSLPVNQHAERARNRGSPRARLVCGWVLGRTKIRGVYEEMMHLGVEAHRFRSELGFDGLDLAELVGR